MSEYASCLVLCMLLLLLFFSSVLFNPLSGKVVVLWEKKGKEGVLVVPATHWLTDETDIKVVGKKNEKRINKPIVDVITIYRLLICPGTGNERKTEKNEQNVINIWKVFLFQIDSQQAAYCRWLQKQRPNPNRKSTMAADGGEKREKVRKSGEQSK